MARITGTATVLVAATTATFGLFALSSFGPAAPDNAVMPAPAAATASTEPGPTTTIPATTIATILATTTTTTTGPAPTETPVSITASNTIVGAGGVVTFDGVCATVRRVFVEIEGQSKTLVEVGESDPNWRYDWTAPTDEAEFGAFAFRFFCGDPADFDGSYPAELEQRVDMVSISPAPPTTILIESQPPVEPPVVSVLPETD